MEAGDEEEESVSGGEHQDDRSPDPEEPSSPEIPKRTRPSRACDLCRKKKVKCEGNPCTNCSNHKTKCTFNMQNRKRPPRKDHKWIARFEARVQRLETRFAKEAPEAWAAFKTEEGASPGESRRHSRGRRSEVEPEQTTPAVAVGGLFIAEGNDFGAYLGPTSPWAFLHHTRSYSRRNLEAEIPTATPLYLSIDAYQSGLSSTLQQSHYTPLTKEQSTRYVDAWFTHAKSVHGYLHRPTFDSTTSVVHTPNIQAPWESRCLCHAVMGLGAWVLGETRRCVQFLQISWSSLASGLFTSQNLQAVQGTHLLAYLLSLIGRHGVAYGLLGHAVRLIFANGMFRDKNLQRMDGIVLNAVEIEERRRTFWGVYHLDAVLSLMLGRPPAFLDYDIACELPLSIDDSKITVDGILPEDVEEDIEIYAHQSLQTLAQQFRKIYRELYSSEATMQRSQETLAVTMHNTDLDLSGWRASQPVEYRPFMSGENTEIFHGASAMQIYFSVAYYYGQCLIHRPALIEETTNNGHWNEDQTSPAVSPSTALRSPLLGPRSDALKINADRCVVAARDVIRLLQGVSARELLFPLLPACIITAGSILVDNIIRDSFAEHVDDDLRLLQSMRPLIGNFDRFMSQPVETALNDLEDIANYALHRNTLPPASTIQLPEIPLTYYPVQPQVPESWPPASTSYEHHGDRFVAGPMEGPFGLPFPVQGQSSYQMASSYDYGAQVPSTMTYQFPRSDTGPSGLQHYSQPLPPVTTGGVSPEQRLQSPLQQGFHQSPHWGQDFPTEFSSSHPQSMQRSDQAWPKSGGHTSPERTVTRPPRGRGHQKRPSRSRGPYDRP